MKEVTEMSLNVPLLRKSFDLVVERQPKLTARFYEILFARHPEVRPLFGRRSTEAQAQMLQEALVAVMDHLEDASWLEQNLGNMGSKHAEYGVTDEMYNWVGAALLATLAEVAGDAWTPELEEAWSDAYGAVAGLVKNGARRAA
jgi:hemoglobin-like flavoprotein